MTPLSPIRSGEGEYDPFFVEHATLAEATARLPFSRRSIVFSFYEDIVVLARPLPRLDGWVITAAGDARFVEEAA